MAKKTNKNSKSPFDSKSPFEKDSDKKVTKIDIIKNADKIIKDQTP